MRGRKRGKGGKKRRREEETKARALDTRGRAPSRAGVRKSFEGGELGGRREERIRVNGECTRRYASRFPRLSREATRSIPLPSPPFPALVVALPCRREIPALLSPRRVQ